MRRYQNNLWITNRALTKAVVYFLFSLPIILVVDQPLDQKEAPPNIVFFFVDDMGWQDTSLPFHSEITDLNRRYHTPNMEQLAADGMKFTQAYATAVCSPSRISLMTGLNAARHRVTNWTLRKDKSPDPENKIIQPPQWNMNGLSPDHNQLGTVCATTLPQLLQKEGYRTIHVGKAHFGAKNTKGEDPLNLGFDRNIAGHAAGGPGSYLGKHNYSAHWRDAGNRIWDVPGLEDYHGSDVYLTEALTREAKKEIKSAVNEDQPFYLYLSHYAIHAPWEIDERFYQQYLDNGLSQFDATFAAMIEGMDKSLGDIRDYIDDLGLTENTIIVFMSDNGSHKQTSPNLPLRGHKLLPYEGGIRVPLLVSWPSVVEAESETDQYVIIEDIFPTFLEMAGIDFNPNENIDGISFVSVLKQEQQDANERAIFWHFPHTYDQFPYSSVRKGDWKLIYHHTDRKIELYNLSDDISEEKDLAEIHQNKKKELVEILSNHLLETAAQMPVDKRTGKRVELPSAHL